MNHPPEEMMKLYDSRIASRILCGTHYELAGVDQRFKK